MRRKHSCFSQAGRRACIHSLTEMGMAATPRARMALALSGVCRRADSSHTSSLPGHSSQPLVISLRASARFLRARAMRVGKTAA